MNERAKDTRTIAEVLHDFYAAISGPKGAPREWEKSEADLWPTCRFNVAERNDDGTFFVRSLTPEEFRLEADEPLVANGFFEIETAREEHVTGDVASVLSAYQARFTPDGDVMYTGTNHLHLIRDQGRWWIVSATWERSSKALVRRRS
jgi:hypothetical protein